MPHFVYLFYLYIFEFFPCFYCPFTVSHMKCFYIFFIHNGNYSIKNYSGFPVQRNNLIATFDQSRAWILSLDVKPLKTTNRWGSVIHLTTGGDCCKNGQRIPAIFFHAKSYRTHICSSVNKQGNHCYNGAVLKPNVFTKITIKQVHVNYKTYKYSISINGKEIYSKINKNARPYKKVKVFVGDNVASYDTAISLVKNVIYKNLPDGKFVRINHCLYVYL